MKLVFLKFVAAQALSSSDADCSGDGPLSGQASVADHSKWHPSERVHCTEGSTRPFLPSTGKGPPAHGAAIIVRFGPVYGSRNCVLNEDTLVRTCERHGDCNHILRLRLNLLLQLRHGCFEVVQACPESR